jgi:hypothetical protein
MKKKISFIISFSYLIISLFILSYVVYRSEIYHDGSMSNYYFKYYLISILLLSFSITSFFFSKEFKYKTTTLIISVIFVFYILEIYLFLSKDDFSNGKFIKKLKSEYEDLVVRIPPNFYANEKSKDLFPVSGISNKFTILCKEYDEIIVYKSDRYGFNNTDDAWDENQIEYLIIGDSYAQGDCVEREYNLSGNLEKISNKRVINLGYAGNGPLLEYVSLKEYLPLTKAKKILWIYYEGNDLDFTNLGTELQDEILLKYLKDKNFIQNLYLKQVQINSMAKSQLKKSLAEYEKKITYDKFKILKLFNLRYLITNFKLTNERESYKISQEFKNIVSMTKELADKNGIDLYIVYIPDNYRYDKKKKFLVKDIHDYKKIIDYFEKLNIPVIDIHSKLLKNKDDPNLKRLNQYHFSKDGYRVISEYIYNFILNYENN